MELSLETSAPMGQKIRVDRPLVISMGALQGLGSASLPRRCRLAGGMEKQAGPKVKDFSLSSRLHRASKHPARLHLSLLSQKGE